MILYTFITYTAMLVMVSLAVHVWAAAPRRMLNQAFAGFALCLAGYYAAGFFLFPGLLGELRVPELAMRLRWALTVFIPAFYFHFTYFYLPGSFRKRLRWLIPSAYVISLLLATACLFSDVVVAGIASRGLRDTVGVVAGPGMIVFFGFAVLIGLISLAGLLSNRQRTPSPTMRQHLTFLLYPLLGLFLTTAYGAVVLAFSPDPLPHQWADVLLILSGVMYAGVVVQYGSFTGRPAAARGVFYTISITMAALILLNLSVAIDLYLWQYTIVPIALLSAFLLTAVVAGFSLISNTVFRWLEVRFRGADPPEYPRPLAVRADEVLDPELLRSELLAALTRELDASGAFLAEEVGGGYLPAMDLAADQSASALPVDGKAPALQVVASFGRLPISPGQRLPRPEPFPSRPTTAAVLSPAELEQHNWYGLAVYSRLRAPAMPDAMLAVCSLETPLNLSSQEQELFSAYARQLELAQQIVHLDRKRQRALEQASSQERAIRQLEDRFQSLLVDEPPPPVQPAQPTAPLQIRVLGPLRVSVAGQPVPEGAWESEKARQMLVYLLWKGPAGAMVGELSDYLWGEKAATISDSTLYVTANRLRRVLEPELERPRESRYVLSEGGRYYFNLQSDCWLDLDAFRRGSLSDDPNDWREAVRLYRGPYLQEEAWNLPVEVTAYQHELEKIYAACLRRLVNRPGETADDLYLEKLLEIEPLDEEANLLLAGRYLSRGRSDLALQLLVRYREQLESIGAEPSSEMRALWRRVEENYQEGLT